MQFDPVESVDQLLDVLGEEKDPITVAGAIDSEHVTYCDGGGGVPEVAE
jgi:hypothetical protein